VRRRAARHGDEGQRGRRELGDEDRPPVERLGEQAPGRGAERGAQRSRERPDADRPGPVSEEVGEQRQGGAQEQGGADPLPDAHGQEDREARGDGARARRDEEDREAQAGQARRIVAAHAREESEGRDGHREVERRDDPGHALDGRVELAQELGQREDDDRRVGEGHRDASRQDRRPQAVPPGGVNWPGRRSGGRRGRDQVL
jgi:hypothetical protein